MLEKPSNDEEDEEEEEQEDEIEETLEEKSKGLFVHKKNEKAEVDTVDEDVLKHMQSLRFETFEEDKEEELIAEEEEGKAEEGFDDKGGIRGALAAEVLIRTVFQNTRPSSTRSIHALRFDEEDGKNGKSTGDGKNGERINEEEEDGDDETEVEEVEEEEKGKEKGVIDDEDEIKGAFKSGALLRTVILLFLLLSSVALPAYQFVT